MASSGRTLDRLPYAVVLRVRWKDGTQQDIVQRRFKRLGPALAYAKRGEIAWLQIIGGRFSPLHWEVCDTRTYQYHNPFTATDPGGSHGSTTRLRQRHDA